MSDLEDKNEEVFEETLTHEEEQKINSIQVVSFVPEQKETPKPVENKSYSIWSVFNIFKNINPADIAAAAGGKQTLQEVPFNIQRRIGINKVVTINNISGKNAYVILTADKIKTIKAIGLGAGAVGIEGNINVEFEDNGETKAQKLSIANNTRSEYELDTSKFHCTLFLHIEGEWKKAWDNRKFNGRRFDINILEKHVQSALDKDNIPDF